MVVINPGLVIGPLLQPSASFSSGVILNLVNGNFWFSDISIITLNIYFYSWLLYLHLEFLITVRKIEKKYARVASFFYAFYTQKNTFIYLFLHNDLCQLFILYYVIWYKRARCAIKTFSCWSFSTCRKIHFKPNNIGSTVSFLALRHLEYILHHCPVVSLTEVDYDCCTLLCHVSAVSYISYQSCCWAN